MRQRIALLFAAFVTMAVMCSAPAQAVYCPGESLDLIDPVVFVLEGPGHAVQEQDRWSSLSTPYIEGHQLHFESQNLDLEQVE